MKSFYQGKKVLVTGGGGFIGSHLVDRLVASGANVRVTQRHFNESHLTFQFNGALVHPQTLAHGKLSYWIRLGFMTRPQVLLARALARPEQQTLAHSSNQTPGVH